MLAGCTGSADDVVVVTEVVTEEVTAGASSDAPADAATAPLSGTRYRLVEDVERFSEGTETYLFSSPDGEIECQIVEQSVSSGPSPEFGGGCVNGGLESARGSTVMFATQSPEEFSWELDPGSYPGHFYGGGPALEVGEVILMSPLLCFVPDEDSLGCLMPRDLRGFLVEGAETRVIDASDYSEIFGGEILVPFIRLEFDNGGSVICYEGTSDVTYTCGDAWDLDFPNMEGSTVQSNAVFFDVSGAQPVVKGHNGSNVGLAGENAQSTPPGTYHHYGFTIEHDGERATFTTPQGGTFWVGVDGFGVD